MCENRSRERFKRATTTVGMRRKRRGKMWMLLNCANPLGAVRFVQPLPCLHTPARSLPKCASEASLLSERGCLPHHLLLPCQPLHDRRLLPTALWRRLATPAPASPRQAGRLVQRDPHQSRRIRCHPRRTYRRRPPRTTCRTDTKRARCRAYTHISLQG